MQTMHGCTAQAGLLQRGRMAIFGLPKRKMFRTRPKENTMFTRLSNALRHLLPISIAEIERDYLNGAISHVDLERRMRDVDGGMFRRWGFDS
jgi:Protein of unknown function (DUF3563)